VRYGGVDWSLVVQDGAGPVLGRCEQVDEPACNCVAVLGLLSESKTD
jgi:hypothetical protein